MELEHLDIQTYMQLQILRDINSIVESLDASYWLRGGWAIDFLLGKVTRVHQDIDTVTWIDNRTALEEKLINEGFQQVSVKKAFIDRQSDFRKNNVDISVGYLTFDGEKNLIMNGLPVWKWRPDSLMPQTYQLFGITTKVIHPKQLLDEKDVYKQIGRPFRQKDAASKEQLNQILSELF